MAGVRQTASGVVQTSGGVAQVLELIDSFKDGDMGEYTVNSGSSSDFTVVDEANVTPSAQDGTMLLELSHGNSSQTYIETTSSSGLDYYPSKPDEFNYWVYSGDYSSGSLDLLGFYHCHQDGNNYYASRIEPNNGQIKLYKEISGSVTSNTASMSFTDGSWYRMNVTWDDGATFGGSDGDMVLTAYDSGGSQVAQTAALNDTTLSGPESVGWFQQSDDSTISGFVDYAYPV